VGTRLGSANKLFCLAVLKFNLMAPTDGQTYVECMADLQDPLAIAVRHLRVPFEPISENKIEFRRPTHDVEAMFDCQHDVFTSITRARR
jgi:hypothetical protein